MNYKSDYVCVRIVTSTYGVPLIGDKTPAIILALI